MRLHPFLDHPLPIAFAHRGGALEAEENTMEAFARAVEMGYRHAETDVHATADGVAVIFHDETLARMAGRGERIAELSWAELAKVRLLGGGRVPRLDALLASFPELHLNLDIKSQSAVTPMAEAIRKTGALARIGVGSFTPARTLALRALLGPDLAWSPAHAGVARVWFAGFGLPLRTAPFQALQVPIAFRGLPIVTRRFLAAAHARGAQVHVWTVDDEAEMARLIALGVDGIMTDRPSLLRKVMIRHGLWSGLT